MSSKYTQDYLMSDEFLYELNDYVKENVNYRRYMHTLGVLNAARKYAAKYGADVRKAEIAAIFHDACKNSVGGLEHGAAAAELLAEKYGVEDEEILNAIRHHTIGRVNMGLLEKVIKLADLLEEGRTYDDVPALRKIEEENDDIDKMVLILVKRQRDVLMARGIEYDKETDRVIEWLTDLLARRYNE